MASFKAKFPVLQELFAKNHRGALWAPPSGARVNDYTERLIPKYEKIGLAGTVPVPCKDEEVSPGSTFLVGMLDFPCFFRLLL